MTQFDLFGPRPTAVDSVAPPVALADQRGAAHRLRAVADWLFSEPGVTWTLAYVASTPWASPREADKQSLKRGFKGEWLLFCYQRGRQTLTLSCVRDKHAALLTEGHLRECSIAVSMLADVPGRVVLHWLLTGEVVP